MKPGAKYLLVLAAVLILILPVFLYAGLATRNEQLVTDNSRVETLFFLKKRIANQIKLDEPKKILESIPISFSNTIKHISAGEGFFHLDLLLNNPDDDPQCMQCHADGLYEEKSAECSNCHLREVYFHQPGSAQDGMLTLVERDYPYHFTGECLDCHQTKSWIPTQFVHRGLYTCLTCHQEDIPSPNDADTALPIAVTGGRKNALNTMILPHYPGDCVICHPDSNNWHNSIFNHHQETCENCHGINNRTLTFSAGLFQCTKENNCQDCHRYEEHLIDYGSACASCHQSYQAWLPVAVDHTDFSDCLTCHAEDRPSAAHGNTACGECHTTIDWQTLKANHALQSDCQSCHQPPADHLNMGFTAQCSTCHDPSSWENAVFNHTLGNCSSCHASPSNHYPALCTSCHDTASWNQISVNHAGLESCSDCHTPPDGHWTGQCSNCHNTTSWSQISFDHTGLTDCLACHSSPTGHPNAQCSQCHNTVSWNIQPTPTPLPSDTPVPPTDIPTTTPTDVPPPTVVPTRPEPGPTRTRNP